MAAILLVGIVAYQFLPLSALPEVDYPTIQVQTFYPGASPDVMTSSVTAPLERAVRPDAGLKQMSSTSSAGASVITLQFNLDLSLDIAEQEVQAAINAAGNLLPADLPAPPIYAKVNPADAPVLTLALTSKTLPLTAGRGPRRHAARAEDLAAARRRPGQHRRRPAAGGARPGQSARAGGLRPQHRRSAHHHRQRQRQHAEGQFRRAVARLHDQRQRPAQTPTTTGKLVIAYKNGAPVRLSDVATVINGAENNKLGAW
jgi:multidrug efflux pump